MFSIILYPQEHLALRFSANICRVEPYNPVPSGSLGTSVLFVEQRFPTFLAPGTDFTEDNFSVDEAGVGCAGWGNGSGSNASDGARAADEALLAHLLLCGLVPNRPRTGTGLWPGGWGPLL